MFINDEDDSGKQVLNAYHTAVNSCGADAPMLNAVQPGAASLPCMCVPYRSADHDVRAVPVKSQQLH